MSGRWIIQPSASERPGLRERNALRGSSVGRRSPNGSPSPDHPSPPRRHMLFAGQNRRISNKELRISKVHPSHLRFPSLEGSAKRGVGPPLHSASGIKLRTRNPERPSRSPSPTRRYAHTPLRSLAVSLLLALPASADPIDTNLVASARLAISRGVTWLAARQQPAGNWSNPRYPALTALPLRAVLRSDIPSRDRVATQAIAFVLRNVNDDGGIYVRALLPNRGGLATYNTAVCMTALHETGDPAYAPIILRARTFVAGSQNLDEGESHYGGFGYSRRGIMSGSDLINTAQAVEAMRLTAPLEEQRPAGDPRADLNWKAVQAFLTQVQNGPTQGSGDAGGFYYRPGKSAAGTTVTPRGNVVFRSYGSMTYMGLLSLIYADVSRDDTRARSAFDWATRHWTLEENPGVGQEGLFFFFHALSRALDAYGQDSFKGPSSADIAWREEVIRKLISLQQPGSTPAEGYWVNPAGSHWENDPTLTTSYCLLTLQTALQTR